MPSIPASAPFFSLIRAWLFEKVSTAHFSNSLRVLSSLRLASATAEARSRGTERTDVAMISSRGKRLTYRRTNRLAA